MEASNLVTGGLIFIAIIIGGVCWFCWHLHRDAHRYAIGVRKALHRLSGKLHQTTRLSCVPGNLTEIESVLGSALVYFEDIVGKIKDDTDRAQLELSFMVVRGSLPGLPIRICIDETVFCFNDGEYNHPAVLKSISDFNQALRKINKS